MPLRSAGAAAPLNCIDADGDGCGSPGDPDCHGGLADDCDDADPDVWRSAGAVEGLRFTDPATIAWQVADPGASAGPLYDLLRSTAPWDFGDGATCVESGDDETAAYNPGLPDPDRLLAYLVRARNDCSTPGGNLGDSSSGAARSGRSCP